MRAQTIDHGLESKSAAYRVVDTLDRIRKQFGLQNGDIRVLRFFINKIRECDLAKGALCGFWDCATNIADELGIDTRQLRRVEERLQQAGLIGKTTNANGARFGERGDDDRIRYFAGIDLAPLINKAKEIEEAGNRARKTHDQLKEMRCRVGALIRQIRAYGEEALGAMLEVDKRLRPSEVQNVHRLRQMLEAFEAIHEELCLNCRRTENVPPPDKSTRPNTHKPKPSHNCRVTPAQARLLASYELQEAIDLYAYRELGWKELILAVRDHAYQAGLSLNTWQRQCDALGEARTAICWIIADRNAGRAEHDRYRVKDCCSAFNGLASQEAREAGLVQILLSELKAFLNGSAGE